MVRPMGKFKVTQRTKDGFFNATALLKQWNLHIHNFGYDGINELKKKDLPDYFLNRSAQELVKTIIIREHLSGVDEVYKKSRANKGENAGTWMHPILFIDFAMWLNPSFRYDVIKFVYDQMIRYRNEAGDAYRQLSSAVQKIVPKAQMKTAMRKVAEALNWLVFNNHEVMERNKHGEESKQRELWELERKVASLIDEGFIKSFQWLMEYLREQYRRKFNLIELQTKTAI